MPTPMRIAGLITQAPADESAAELRTSLLKMQRCSLTIGAMEQTRGQILAEVRSVVIKLGTQLLSDAQKQLDTAYLSEMATQMVSLRQKGIAVTIVSSGAIGAGLRELKLAKRPVDLAQLQAVAAVGQRRLMDC